ncbi:MAG TPA: hypothetical protein PKM44_10390, partial [Turneriella sp.]|nr:hypothetical protein [Turneriella sp.]
MKQLIALIHLLLIAHLAVACGKVTGKDELAKESGTAGVANPNSPEGSTPGAPPAYVSHTRINPSLLEVTLTKELTDATATNTSNFIFNNGLQAVSVAKKAGEPATLQITTTTQQQINYGLTILGVTTVEAVTLSGVIQITFEGLPSPAITSVDWRDPATPASALPANVYGISLCQLGSGAGSVCTTAPFYNRSALHGILTGGNAVAYSYKIDAGSWSAETPMATPLAVTGLADGFHTIYIIGKHTNGYWQSQTATDVFTLSWVQDTVAPEAYIDPLTYPASVTASTSFNVRVIGTDVSFFRYCLDNGATGDCTANSWQGNPAPAASSGYALPIGSYAGSLVPGAVTLKVIGIDRSGNVQSSAIAGGTYSYVVDTGSVEALFNASDVAAITTTGTTVSVRITNAAGAVAYKGKIVSGTDCNAGTTWDLLPETALSTPITATGLSANGGYYTVCAIGKSLGNNWQGGWTGAATANVVTKYSWIVDTTAPTAQITWLSPYELPTTTTETSYQWQISTSDGVTHYRSAIVTGAGASCASATYDPETSVANAISFTAATTGVNTYKLCVIARDAAGNYQAIGSATSSGEWTVDKEAPGNNPAFASASQSARSFSVPVIQFDIDNGSATADSYFYRIEIDRSTGFASADKITMVVESCKTETSANCPATVGTRSVTVSVDPYTQGSVYARVQAGDKYGNYRTDFSATSAEHFVVGKITGTVQNTAAQALSGITVALQDSTGASLSAAYPNQTTDATGHFTFNNIRTAKNAYRVAVALGDATYRPAMKQKVSVREQGSGGTIVTNVGRMTLVAQSATTPQNIVAKVVDGDDGWMLGYAEVRLLDYAGNVVGSVQRTVYTNNAYTDCDSTPPAGDPPTNIPKQQFSSGGICGDFTFTNVTPGTYTLQVTGNSWASGNQAYNDLLQEDVVVTGPQESRFLIVRAGNATTSTIYDPVRHAVRAGPTISGGAAIGDGAHVFAITSGPFSGRYLLIRGNNQNTTRIFNPIDNSSTINGPNLSATAGAGAHSFAITSGTHAGKTLIVHGRNTNTTSLYDPATHTIVAGPTLSGNAGAGAHAFTLTTGDNAGRTVIVHGNGLTTTSLYNPATHTAPAGLTFASAISTGAFAFPISSGVRAGQMRIVAGNGTNVTHVYVPGSPDSIAVGSTLSAAAGAGASAFEITTGGDSGKTLFIHGNTSTTTSLFDPAADSFGTGPATSSAIGVGSSNFSIDSGTHSGKRFVTRGANTTNTFLFDPATSTFSDGLTLSNDVNTGAFALKLESISAGRLPLVRALTGQDLKVVLSWGAGDPYDLDLHVVGTLPAGQTVTNVNN